MKPLELSVIHFSFHSKTVPSKIYKALTSQNELRKWWAPKVVMSRSSVSQEPGQNVRMKLIHSDKNHLVRYTWRPEDWDKSIPDTIITFTIQDLGASREDTGEGLLVDIVHDGWLDASELEKQKKIWILALRNLKALLRESPHTPWWEKKNYKTSLQQIRLTSLKQLLDVYQKNASSTVAKKIHQASWRICTALDKYGKWYLREGEHKFEFHHENKRLFELSQVSLILFWKHLKEKLGICVTEEFARRLNAEQDIEASSQNSRTSFSLVKLSADIWITWAEDLIEEIESIE